MFAKLKQRYATLLDDKGCSPDEIQAIATALALKLPDDFITIARFFSGGSLGEIDFFSFTRDCAPNIVDETLRLRQAVALPQRYVFLAGFAESVVLYDTEQSHAFWFLAAELPAFLHDATVVESDVWASFADLFAECLADEEAA
ncbi:SMI1/KNR4 family protein [Kingella oralis]|mgnify:FL=1|jgi:hypothetical protein|uniref:SMI1/KNR4 family protein n=1 Tax=Kingella oralis TaxID=505 RepID=UPI0028EE4FA8|nr:SMI1/KNR4 family protein [Kingella oralis]